MPPTAWGERPPDDDRQDQSHLGHDVLQPFDVNEDEREFLADIIGSRAAPSSELQLLFNSSLKAGVKTWEALIECARSLQARGADPTSLDGNDLLTFVWYIVEPRVSVAPEEAWHETDRLIGLAKQLELQAAAIVPFPISPSPNPRSSTKSAPASPPGKQRRQDVTSHYWDREAQLADREETHSILSPTYHEPSSVTFRLVQNAPTRCLRRNKKPGFTDSGEPPSSEQWLANPIGAKERSNQVACYSHNAVSPYFAPGPPPRQKLSSMQPQPGAVSCVPFPPLDSTSFGLVQENVAHEPFWLLIAVTFLIRTKGTTAVPVFYAVKEKFPSPALIASPANADKILSMIRHLGLSVNRLGFLQKYARIFIDSPPKAGKVYRVRNYDRREVVSVSNDAVSSSGTESNTGVQTPREDDDAEAWEIGHMTQGKYALDSWRIFCRDVLLGRADDWNGKGREPEFQPEWMRVRPDDKELRAYLRWMWMREGWEWDPATGERKVLTDEMSAAVNEKRVEYDGFGGLTILEQPRPSE